MLINFLTSLDQWSFSSCVCSAANSKATQDPNKKNYRPQVDEKEREDEIRIHTATCFRIGGRPTRSQNVRTWSIPAGREVEAAFIGPPDTFRETLGNHFCDVWTNVRLCVFPSHRPRNECRQVVVQSITVRVLRPSVVSCITKLLYIAIDVIHWYC
jgi:hypothetical protein